MNKEDFTATVKSNGYMIYYKGKSIGGAGNNNTSKHWRHKQADLKMYREQADREINNIISGHGQGRLLKVIEEIDRLAPQG